MDPDDGARLPLLNLAKVSSRMDNVGRFLSDSLNTNTVISEAHMELVSKEITAAINQVIVNGAALLAGYNLPLPSTTLNFDLKTVSESDLNVNHSKDDVDADADVLGLGFPKSEVLDDEIGEDWDIVELDAVELLAEHLHFCDICGKGFKRDANLRMHMRAHGNKFKTLEALAKPEKSVSASESSSRRVRFSCPFAGCSRNKLHKKFRPLKSVICVRNHFKRSHCPKMYACNRCHKKNFSVLADLKSHLKHCGDTKWKCSCGTSFSRKDKLFGHIALFEGHMPAMPMPMPMPMVMPPQEDHNPKPLKPESSNSQGMEWDMFFDGLGSIDDDFCIQDLIGSGSNGDGIDWNL